MVCWQSKSKCCHREVRACFSWHSLVFRFKWRYLSNNWSFGHVIFSSEKWNSYIFQIDIDKKPYNPLYTRLARYGTPSEHLPLHLLLSSSSVTIVEALKLTKSGKRSQYNLAIVDFYTIEVQDVKRLPLSFDNDILLHCVAWTKLELANMAPQFPRTRV